MPIKQKYISNLDLLYLLCVAGLLIMGVVAIHSATASTQTAALKYNHLKQVLWAVVGSMAFIVVVLLPMKFFRMAAYPAYAVGLFLLLVLAVIGGKGGVGRWFSIGFVYIQPSELMKIGVVLALARYLSQDRRDPRNPVELAGAFALVGAPFLVILKQPDLGTALVMAVVLLPMLNWAGMPWIYSFLLIAPFLSLLAAFNYYTFFFAMLLIFGVMLATRMRPLVIISNLALNIAVGGITPFLWGNLKVYQQKRILTFLGLQPDPQGAGYQVIQSKIAIGSGGIWGKGLMKGTQTQLRFLPEQHTDFIFSAIGEELGFVGAITVLVLFAFILFRGINIAAKVRNRFSSLVVIGLTVVLAFHLFVNVGMTIGIMPVTGLPLPFVSYGGSFLVTSFTMIGLIWNASRNRYRY